MSMAAAGAAQVAWLTTAASQAQRTATAAKAAAAAYKTTFAMTVPPPVIAANRALLTTLVATNFPGRNTPAIAATEVHYARMWTRNATAMYEYASASAAAATLTPFTPPAQASVSEGLASLQQLITALPIALQGLASSHVSITAREIASLPLRGIRIATIPATYITAALSGKNVGNMLERLSNLPAMLAALVPGGLGPAGPGTVHTLSGPMSAGLGQAATIGTVVGAPGRGCARPRRQDGSRHSPDGRDEPDRNPLDRNGLAALAGRAGSAVVSVRNK
ncbi:putative PPE family protein PPE32 [Mycobacterium simulans]|uniref:Putative PPE family protein PPE32 n=2 Tax=Mycobacterium simulans TaxID=627089 RepID=A0A7Z7N8Z2_9MYCO|nr:putative PPE family protein PPE32 [Mycobacterium simulans]